MAGTQVRQAALDREAAKPNHRAMTAVPQAATVAYIDGLGADTLAKAAACTSGSHGLLLWAMEWKASHGAG
jgi:hypothetical protein